ncbi:[FeFe] hydrogenase H-cluster radical SAM maturase HydE [Thermanaerosceptrum fracticalcis]|uniref:[FeFe] hydrogenase H-cluster radical SAM maturase HydE n=1 Tax=Thermanaerosceptrum fracticalcis TaxID=1712410 RepID=A0A7G6E7I5_THEFR|nr:[FeFe] hydrogenase H-cluster radical SAM maturase HydE [Thermanaerosceptrum fracticalcis]QNB48039.1 [FeFe] hydrogenase H-cluster radical SAM maturase HydE [Thermanaerosceptrum fracticalcis]
MRSIFIDTLAKAQAQEELNKDDLKVLLSADGEEASLLFKHADAVREKYLGKEVHLRGIIELTNYCKQNCHYCGLRRGNEQLSRYRLTYREILTTAEQAVALGYKTLVLQGGEDSYFSARDIYELVKEIKKMDVAVTLSLGEHDFDTYKLWREAGSDRYLIKHETADPHLYEHLRPGKRLKQRLQCQSWLKELGYELGSGCMVGLPGQTLDTLAEDLLLLKKMDVDMAGIGPFIPHPQTPLASAQQGTLEMTLKMVALARIIMPLVHLPATTALGTIHPEGREKALQAGANVVMPNVSPSEYRALYQIYPNKICIRDEPVHCRSCITGKIKALGRVVSTTRGHSPKGGITR